MKKINEKATLQFNCKTVNELIDVLKDIKSVMGGNVRVGRVNSLHPDIDVQLYNYEDGLVVLN